MAAARRRQLIGAACCALVGVTLAGCGASATASATRATPSSSPSPSATLPTPSSPATPAPAALGPPLGAGIRWLARGDGVGGTSGAYVATLDHGLISLLWLDPTLLRFRLIAGTQVPEGSPSTRADRTSSTWLGRMVAAFNGGFWLRDHAGGFVYAGHVVRPLSPGYASLVITAGGVLRVVAWPTGGSLSGLSVVRQNLEPVIVGHRIAPKGITGHGGWSVPSLGSYVANRSALAQLDNGSIVYLFGYRVTPDTVAHTLLSIGARTAMMLDMNGSWPMAFTYTHAPALTGLRINPHQYHDPSVYLRQYRKDFVVASA
jgi:hypothetical protein